MNERSLRVAWAAGIFDGEGCIFASRGPGGGNRRVSVSPGLTVVNTDRRILDNLQLLWPLGKVLSKPSEDERYKDRCTWRIVGRAVVPVLEEAYPHLVSKQKQAFLALVLASTLLPLRQGLRLPRIVAAARHGFWELMKGLNRFGRPLPKKRRAG